MNHAIGCRIRDLRTSRQMSQDQMAERLQTTRQRLARLESGQIDVSYSMLRDIAGCLGVSVKDITNVETECQGLVAFFRDARESEEVLQSVEKIERILRTFRAHEKLYHQMKARNEREN